VLTGVHIGRYGKDLNPPKKLLDILVALEQVDDLERIRLSSLEPLEIDQALLEWVMNSTKVCHHFHIPLQSGDDEILKKMNRNYSSKKYVEVVHRIKQLIPDCGLGTDIIVGFPGETEQQFQNTLRLVEQLPFTYLHVFSFSPRAGTKAVNLPGRVNPKEIKRRSEVLRETGSTKKKEFLQDLVGKKVAVLWEEKRHGDWMAGFSGNYVRVRARANPKLMNKICNVNIKKAESDFVQGEVIINSNKDNREPKNSNTY